MKEKLKTASEESWKEMTNLSAKIQKHQAFEAEVIGHKYVLDGLDDSGNAMINDGHFSKDIIQASILVLLSSLSILYGIISSLPSPCLLSSPCHHCLLTLHSLSSYPPLHPLPSFSPLLSPPSSPPSLLSLPPLPLLHAFSPCLLSPYHII